jgi:hypothetical protein
VVICSGKKNGQLIRPCGLQPFNGKIAKKEYQTGNQGNLEPGSFSGFPVRERHGPAGSCGYTAIGNPIPALNNDDQKHTMGDIDNLARIPMGNAV